jgi:hypothetical protein
VIDPVSQSEGFGCLLQGCKGGSLQPCCFGLPIGDSQQVVEG